MSAAATAKLQAFASRFGLLHFDAGAHVASFSGRLDQMWTEVYTKYLPSKLPPVTTRRDRRALVIAPGFGILATPEQMAVIARAGFELSTVFAPNPEDPSTDLAVGCNMIRAEIRRFKPHALVLNLS